MDAHKKAYYQLRQKRLLQLFWATEVALMILMVLPIFKSSYATLIIQLAALAIIPTYFLAKSGDIKQIKIAGNIILIVLTIMLLINMWLYEGIKDEVMLVFPAIIIYSLYIGTRYLTVLLFLLIIINTILNGILNQLGYVSNMPSPSSIPSAILIIVIFSATFYGVFLLARDIAKNQTALRKSQKLLETRVKERTIELENSVKKLLQTQEQLIESEKMASLGRLVAGIAHEINTPLGIAITAASHLEAETTSFNKKFNNNKISKSELAKFIAVNKQCSDLVLSNLSRADELIISLKDISVDQSTEECRTINLKAYINEIILSLTPKIKNTKINVCVIGNESIKIKSIPGFIAQVITNLFMNAVNHAFQQKTAGNITITIKPLENNQAVNIIFSDDGCGISADIKDKIFEPFFTTNRAQGGTGLGLNIVYSLVTQKLKGSINCESTLGIGTQFIITLPLEITKESSSNK